MLIVGGVAGIAAVLALLAILTVLGAFALYGGLWFIGLLLSTAGGLLMGWASWRNSRRGWQVQPRNGEQAQLRHLPLRPAAPMPPTARSAMAPPPAAPMSQPMDSDRSENDPQP
jgi:hypothetical protein